MRGKIKERGYSMRRIFDQKFGFRIFDEELFILEELSMKIPDENSLHKDLMMEGARL